MSTRHRPDPDAGWAVLVYAVITGVLATGAVIAAAIAPVAGHRTFLLAAGIYLGLAVLGAALIGVILWR